MPDVDDRREEGCGEALDEVLPGSGMRVVQGQFQVGGVEDRAA